MCVLCGMAVSSLDPSNVVRCLMLDLGSCVEKQPTHAVCRYASLHHLVVVPKLAPGVVGDDARHALRLAVLRAAVHLARTAEVESPDAEDVIELGPASDELPRVAYVFQLHSHQLPTVAGEPVLYGDNVRHLLPTIIHPNEILDGAVVRPYSALMMETYGIQNHAVLLELLSRHGRDLNLVGVVVYVANQYADERERATVMASNLVRWTLRADGAVLTKSGGGAPHVDMANIAERCEELGVKTAMLMWNTGGESSEDTALFNAPSLNAIVSLGASGFSLRAGPVERVIAPYDQIAEAARGPTAFTANRTPGMMDHLGSSRLTALAY